MAIEKPAGTSSRLWQEYPAEQWADAIVAAMKAGGIDHLFFTSGSEIGFYEELIALAKVQPGKLAYASFGSLTLLSGALFASMAGVDMLSVPFGGVGPLMTAISNNDVQVSVVPVFSSTPLLKSGKVRALAITSAKRSPVAPDYPAVSESGLPGYEAVAWYGVFATGGTPKPVVDRLNAEIRRVVASADVRDALFKQGADPVTDTPEQFAAIVRADVAKWANIVKQTGVKPN